MSSDGILSETIGWFQVTVSFPKWLPCEYVNTNVFQKHMEALDFSTKFVFRLIVQQVNWLINTMFLQIFD